MSSAVSPLHTPLRGVDGNGGGDGDGDGQKKRQQQQQRARKALNSCHGMVAWHGMAW